MTSQLKENERQKRERERVVCKSRCWWEFRFLLPSWPRTLLKGPSASSCCFSCSQWGTEVTLEGNLPIPNAETLVGEGAASGKIPKQVMYISGSQLSFSWAGPPLRVSRLWPWSQPSHQLAFDLRQVLVAIWIGSSFQFFALNKWMGK